MKAERKLRLVRLGRELEASEDSSRTGLRGALGRWLGGNIAESPAVNGIVYCRRGVLVGRKGEEVWGIWYGVAYTREKGRQSDLKGEVR